MKVCFATPTMIRPYPEMVDAMLAEVPFIREAGLDDYWAWEIGNAYISYARAILLRKALTWLGKEDGCIVFVDHDLSWKPGDLTRLVQTKGDIVAGTYRLKSPMEEYMGRRDEYRPSKAPVYRPDGAMSMILVPAGFLKISKVAIEMIVNHYPNLSFCRDTTEGRDFYDLFNHGVIDHTWFGEDYAFSLRWCLMKQKIWLVPDLEITHHNVTHGGKKEQFPGKFSEYLAKHPYALCKINEAGDDLKEEAAA